MTATRTGYGRAAWPLIAMLAAAALAAPFASRPATCGEQPPPGKSADPKAEAPKGEAGKSAPAGESGGGGEERAAPTLEEIYANYRPDFVNWGWAERGGRLQLSLQPFYNNMAYIEHDFRVDGLIKAAREKESRGEYRDAMRLYQEVIDKFQDDLWRIADEGIFVPSVLYAHRRLLAMPRSEQAYYRTMKDPEAKQLFQRAARYNSLPDYAEVVEKYMATSWGDDALFALGNAAMDEGKYNLARHYFEQIIRYDRLSDLDRRSLNLRLAEVYKKLEDEEKYRAAREAALAAKGSLPDEVVRKRLDEIASWKPEAKAFFEQRRNPEYISLNDYTLFPGPETDLSSKMFVWQAPLPYARNDQIPFCFPWVAGNRIFYKHKNGLFARSLLTGEEKWVFAPGGFLDWFDSEIDPGNFGPYWRFYPDQDVLVHDGLVFASVYKGGPNLVAVDMLTGQLRWVAGPMAAVSDRDFRMRFLCHPTAGPNCVYAPFVYDEIEGNAHLYSEAGLICFESRTGKVLWQRKLVRLSPRKFTISKIVRKIRIYSSPPALVDGVLYHTTNCGIIAAVDALSGQVRWATRYPHGETAHDTEEKPGHLWANRAPIVRDGRIYVTPVDSTGIYCLDAETGKVIWSQNNLGARYNFERSWGPKGLVGVTSKGDLILHLVDHVAALDSKTGAAKWAYHAGWPHPDRRGGQRVYNRPTITAGDKVMFGGFQGWPHWVWSQTCVDGATGKRIAERWYFSSEYLSTTPQGHHGPPRSQVFNTEDPFLPCNRMTFHKHGTLFEIDVTPNQLRVKYDPGKVMATASASDSPTNLFIRGELAIMAGRVKEAIEILERARSGLLLEEASFRAEINQQLFRLYERQAQAAMQLGNLAEAEKYVAKMTSACTTGEDEIKVLLGTAEIYEKRKKYDAAATCLSAAIRHYDPVRYGVSSLLLSDQDALKAKGHELLANLASKKPQRYFDREIEFALKCMDSALENYFSIISPVSLDMRVETGQFASSWLQRIMRGPGAGLAEGFERKAEEAFREEKDEEAVLRLLREYPATKAAQAALSSLVAAAMKMPDPDRRIRLWRYRDAAAVNGLEMPADAARAAELRVKPEAPAALTPPYEVASYNLEADANTVLRLLNRRSGRSEAENLLFIGMRCKRAHGFKFGVICWDAAAGKQLWRSEEMRLEGTNETGFEECVVRDGRLIVWGRSEVKALDLKEGKQLWRFIVPFGFEIEYAAGAGELLILSGRDRTLAIHQYDGRVVWETAETGAPYREPLAREGELILVRVNPSGVAFRNLGTGRLITQQDVPELLPNRAHPVLKSGGEETPLGFDGRNLLLTDGWDYIVLDTALHKTKWQKRIEDVDRFTPLPLPYRLWISGNELYCLKQQYDTAAGEMLDTETGAYLWKKVEDKKEGVVYSAAWDGKNIYGIHYEPELRSVTLLGFERRSGKQVLSWTRGNYEAPEVFMDPEIRGRHAVVTVKDKNRFQLLAVNVDKGELDAEVSGDGSGNFGNYGEASCEIQSRFLGLLTGTRLTVGRPK
ncbi:MAG: PQQ-binding-like beta-propeller repeat protein [Planctomycetota bacterium]|nr:PQQ-binding-like beta-propeller repeat protein [Planctomycetota bacterium]